MAKPAGDEPVKLGALGYFRARNRGRAHNLVLTEFKRSGISKAMLARRLRKRPEVVTRLLSGPGNWTMDTYSDLLFAISGAESEYKIARPLDAPRANDSFPDWLNEDVVVVKRTSATEHTRSADASSTPPARPKTTIEFTL